jgi:quercetin dioxygenase-like cupin family protein
MLHGGAAAAGAAARTGTEGRSMDNHIGRPWANWRALGMAGACAALALAATGMGTAGQAGQCPADQGGPPPRRGPPRGPRTTGKGLTEPVIGPIAPPQGRGVTDSILATIQLSEEPAGIHGRQLRLRRLVVEPGGIVPWHSHGNRPAIIYIVEGEITEYANTCAIPILHRAGETAVERNPTAHWWRNTGDRPVVLLSADLFPTTENAHVM